jgi:hypothetical protein
MANNHEQFVAFHDAIKANDSRIEKLKGNRKALRERIRNYFKNNLEDEIQPKFYSQGSFAVGTILNPIVDDDGLAAYDLDDGVYFIGESENDKHEIQWYHDKIYAAVDGHTDQKPNDKNACVRVNYADGHHIDLPIYFKVDGDEHPQLAHKKKPWTKQDAQEFNKWFEEQCSNKRYLREIVRFLKAWRDWMKYDKSVDLPCGFILTILAANHYTENDASRWDVIMKDTLVSIHDELSKEGHFKCKRPVSPNEDLFEHYSETKKHTFLSRLKSFKEDAVRAVESKNQKEGCEKWQKYFGDRFSCSSAQDVDEDAQQKAFAGKIRGNSQYA